MKKKIKAKFFHESETFKEVEYDVVEHQKGQSRFSKSAKKVSVFKEKDKRTVAIPIQLNFRNSFLLPHDLYIDLDLLLYGPQDGFEKSIVNDYKRIDRIEQKPQSKMVIFELSNSQQQIFDFSPIITKLKSLSDSKLVSRVSFLQNYQQQCQKEIEGFQSFRALKFDYLQQRKEYNQAKKDQIISQFDFQNRFIICLDKELNLNTGQSELSKMYYSDKMIDLYGVNHCLDITGMKKNELTCLLFKLGTFHIFSRHQHTEFLFYLYSKEQQGLGQQIHQVQQTYEFQTLDNIKLKCQGMRYQFNIDQDDEQMGIEDSSYFSADYLVIYELFIEDSTISSLNELRNKRIASLNFAIRSEEDENLNEQIETNSLKQHKNDSSFLEQFQGTQDCLPTQHYDIDFSDQTKKTTNLNYNTNQFSYQEIKNEFFSQDYQIIHQNTLLTPQTKQLRHDNNKQLKLNELFVDQLYPKESESFIQGYYQDIHKKKCKVVNLDAFDLSWASQTQ